MQKETIAQETRKQFDAIKFNITRGIEKESELTECSLNLQCHIQANKLDEAYVMKIGHKYVDVDALEQMLDNMIARYDGKRDVYVRGITNGFGMVKRAIHNMPAVDVDIDVGTADENADNKGYSMEILLP